MKKYICELVGTCLLVFVGCGATAITGTMFGVGPIITPLVFGLTYIALSYVTWNVSGSHFNPAISLAMFLDKRLSDKDLLFYLIAQFVGAFAGAALIFLFLNQSSIVEQYGVAQFGMGVNGFADASTFGVSMVGAFIAEVVLTFVLVLVYLSVSANKKSENVAGIVVGLAIAALIFIGFALTGASLNPARSFGPALMTLIASGDNVALTQLWVFIVAPLVGGIIAFGFFKFVVKKPAAPKKVEPVKKPEPPKKEETPKKPVKEKKTEEK